MSTMTVKKFIALSCEAMESLSKKEARETFKSIKNKSNKLWLKFSDAETALSLKVELNEQIEELEEEIEDNPNNKDKFTKQLNNILCKSSTIRLIRDLEIGFNKKPGSFICITETSKVQIHSNNNKKLHQKQLMTSTTNETTHDEDSDEDDEVFSFAAYMKLREKNLGDDSDKSDSDNDDFQPINDINIDDIHKKITQNIQHNIIHENKKSTPDLYPVDPNANYNIIAQHFKSNVTKNKNVDHSVLDFDDLQSIKLDQDTDDDYADSQMSITNSKSKTDIIKEKNDTNDNNNDRKWSMDDTKEQRNDTDSDSDSDSSSDSSYSNHKKNGKIRRDRHQHDESDDDMEDDDNDFYDGESALNVKPAMITQISDESIKNKYHKDKKVSKKKMKNNKIMKKKPPKIKSKRKIVGKKGKENASKKGKTKVNGVSKEPEMELQMMSKFDATWNVLSDRAIKDCNWNNEDCEQLIDEACVLKKKQIIIHSMWILKCKEYCNKNKNKTKNIKFCVIIGYPNGQICTAAKISEVKYCVKQKIDKIILYVCCGKIIDRDWKYIKKEVMSVYKVAGKKCQLEVKYPKTNKISDKTAAFFEQTVSQIIDK